MRTQPYSKRDVPEAQRLKAWLPTELGNIQRAIPVLSRVIVFAEAAPTTGTWMRGDRVYDQTPTAGGTEGWVCTASGTPGTWKAFGSIAP